LRTNYVIEQLEETKRKWTTNKHYRQWCQGIISARSGRDIVQYPGCSRCQAQPCSSHTPSIRMIAVLCRPSLLRPKRIWHWHYTALVDRGYHNGKQIEICKLANITTIVASWTRKSNENSTTTNYLVLNYDQTTDTYTCPQAKRCIHRKWHKKK
jgi:hypothetical protein